MEATKKVKIYLQGWTVLVKILIAGDGKVGATLTRQLSAEGYDLTLIDSNQQVLESSIERYDVLSVQGNCASMETLRQAGVEGADLLIAATSADEVNLLCCMTAHGMNPNICTPSRASATRSMPSRPTAMRDAFALSLTVNPEKQAALEIERLLKYPGFLKRDTFAKGRVEIVELRVEEGSRLCNVPLSGWTPSCAARCWCAPCCATGTAVACRTATFVLLAGDRIFVTAPSDNLAILLKSLGIAHAEGPPGAFWPAAAASATIWRRSAQVRAFRRPAHRAGPERCTRAGRRCCRKPASSRATPAARRCWRARGWRTCDALVTLTGLDELNMVISLYGTSLGVPQVITKLGRVENSKILDTLPIGSVICPKELCCNTIVRYVRAMQNQVGAAP
jgi:trk system potassium uptake protein TrkA